MSLRRPTPSSQPGQEKQVCVGVQGLSLNEICRIENPNKQTNDSKLKMPTSCQDVGVFLKSDENAEQDFEDVYKEVLETARDFSLMVQGEAEMEETSNLTVAGINWTAIKTYNELVRNYYTLNDGKTKIIDTTKAFPKDHVDGLATGEEQGGKRKMETKVGDFKKIWIDELKGRTRGAETTLGIEIRDSVWVDTLQKFDQSVHNPPVMIVIDTQIDFAQEGRCFTILGCKSMVPDICSCLRTFNGAVVCSRDYQPVADESFAVKNSVELVTQVGEVCTNGPFPPHCIIPSTMGSAQKVEFETDPNVPPTDANGSKLVPSLVKVLKDRLDDPDITYKETYVVFKGMFRKYDSFGMFPYEDRYKEHNRTLQSRFGKITDKEAYKPGVTGSYTYKGAAGGLKFVQLFRSPQPNDEQKIEYINYTKAMLDFDPMWTSPLNDDAGNSKTKDDIRTDLESKEQMVLKEVDPKWNKFDTGIMNCLLPRGTHKNTVFICGVCLTFCVIDTAMNLKSMRNDVEVYIVVDLTRASNLRLPDDKVYPSLKGNPASTAEYADPRGYLNSPLYLLAICKIYGIKLCTVQDLVRAEYCNKFKMSIETTTVSGSGAFSGPRGKKMRGDGTSEKTGIDVEECPPGKKKGPDGSCLEQAMAVDSSDEEECPPGKSRGGD